MKRKLGMNCDACQGLTELEALELIKKAGFDSFFLGSEHVTPELVANLKTKGDQLGLEFTFIHAPFYNINAMWMPGDDYLANYNDMIMTIDAAAENGVPYVVIHASAGWDAPAISDIGLERYDALMAHAAEKKVTLAVENSRVAGNIAYFTERYRDYPYTRFCLDVGHEHCFTKTVRFMDLFTDRMVVTHIHDNFGRGSERIGMPDLHLLPFDGNVDYHRTMRELDAYGYTGPLMLEIDNKPERYQSMTAEEFVNTAFERVCRLAAL